MRPTLPPSAETADAWKPPTQVQERLIINFHGIGEPWDGVAEDERPYWCPRALWPAMADAIAEVAEQGKVRVEVTFDDGNFSDIEEALPVLLERQLMATFHICAGRIGEPHFLSSGHLRALGDSGMEIGSHGWNHVDLRGVPDSELLRETVESRGRIAEASGANVTSFAIPFGSYDRRVLQCLKGYSTVFTSDRMRAPLSGWLVPRHSYRQGWQPQDIEQFASERYSVMLRARHRAISLYKRWRSLDAMRRRVLGAVANGAELR
jgi:peptidoglycan/xylan/chitin deacetylase (PgdA/CDA1 family)